MTVAVLPVPAAAGSAAETAQAEVAAVLAGLAALRAGAGWGWVSIRRPRPTAAFSRQDTRAAGYARAREVAADHGFAPVVRPAGGRLAAYHCGALLIDVLGRHPAPAAETERRFAVFGQTLTRALRGLGIDARLGPVPDEYCPGRYSVNVGGRSKLAGTAQRLTGGSFLLTGVLLVVDAAPVRAVLEATYPCLGLAFDPDTVGSVADHVTAVDSVDVAAAVLAALGEVLPLGEVTYGVGTAELQVPLADCWRVEQ